jgi:hypothetical protein
MTSEKCFRQKLYKINNIMYLTQGGDAKITATRKTKKEVNVYAERTN